MSEALIRTLRERASYLRVMVPEGLSEIERQSMQAMEDAANELARLNLGLSTILVNLDREPIDRIRKLILNIGAGQEINIAAKVVL